MAGASQGDAPRFSETLQARSFGVMQGRLSPVTRHGYQAFPLETWRAEFSLAYEMGFDHVEWIVDSWSVDVNPLVVSPADIAEVVAATSVNVISVCADFLMDTPLSLGREEPWRVLTEVFTGMKTLGVTDIILPYVDSSSLRTGEALHEFKLVSTRLTELALAFDVRVSLETDLDPENFGELLVGLPADVFSVNYDIGNSASLGYNYRSELETYGDRISIVHIKDRLLRGFSVPLGEGDARVMSVLEELKALGFAGTYTMQAFRDDGGVDILRRQLAWLASGFGETSTWN